MQAWRRWLLAGLVVTGAGALWGGAQAVSGTGARPTARTPWAAGAHRTGSAFQVAPGLLVTNAHVVLRCRAEGLPVEVSGQPGPWRVLADESSNDLALLAGPAWHGDAPLPLSAAPRLPRGTPVMVMGYPATAGRPAALQASNGQLRRAALTVHDPEAGRAVSFVMTDRNGQEVEANWEDGLRYFGADKADRLRWRLEIDAMAAGGSSGGPVLDGAGNVVGVVYAGGTGFTSAVPLADLREFLSRAGVVPMFRAPASHGPVDWETVRRRAADGVKRIAC
ncbi:serine protease [Roseomonas sp. GC11]|uniref:S1 family peptidase n=1 Tax=Roseomonas sp. GC11 TaxID=2950546 RepID=UPI00210E2C00|nr:serine protease [Roseomonas sp. GC11]MCQ4159929.1 serine protease [Roseomonas sp. GC11]